MERISFSFFFFHFLDLLYKIICDILQFLFAVFQIILCDLVIFLELFDIIHRIAADIADSHFALLGTFGNILNQFLTALLGKRRENQADHFAVIIRVDPDLRRVDCLFISLIMEASHGWIISILGSGTLIAAT